MKPKPLDYLSIAAVLLLALLSAIPLLVSRGGMLVISSDSGEVRYALDEEREITVSSGGHTLTVKTARGRASVVSADCPDGLCMASPAISRGGESIVCMPARVVIRIDGDSSGGGTDVVVG